jgi:hypothetical protein
MKESSTTDRRDRWRRRTDVGSTRKGPMTKKWKAVVLFSLVLNLVCFLIIADVGERLVDAQLENLNLFLKLSADQQALRRDLNAAKATFNHGR